LLPKYEEKPFSALMVLSITTRCSRQQMLKSLDRLPKMSPMTMRLLSRLAHRDCEVSELAALVEQDALLSAQLLRLANSAAFGRLQTIENIPHAITMVGIAMMRKMALGFSITNLFSRVRTAPSFSMVRFNLHSIATATLAELLAAEAPVEHPYSSFIAGLLHDVGKLLIAVSAPNIYEEMLAIAAINRTPLLELECEALSMDHAELSQLAISRWELPEPIQWAARFHHIPDQAQSVERPAPGRIGLSMAIHKANAFVNHLGMSVLPNLAAPPEAPSLAIPGFRIAEELILQRFEDEWVHLGELVG
jgi:HD-like signal output (HDOD) protein